MSESLQSPVAFGQSHSLTAASRDAPPNNAQLISIDSMSQCQRPKADSKSHRRNLVARVQSCSVWSAIAATVEGRRKALTDFDSNNPGLMRMFKGGERHWSKPDKNYQPREPQYESVPSPFNEHVCFSSCQESLVARSNVAPTTETHFDLVNTSTTHGETVIRPGKESKLTFLDMVPGNSSLFDWEEPSTWRQRLTLPAVSQAATMWPEAPDTPSKPRISQTVDPSRFHIGDIGWYPKSMGMGASSNVSTTHKKDAQNFHAILVVEKSTEHIICVPVLTSSTGKSPTMEGPYSRPQSTPVERNGYRTPRSPQDLSSTLHSSTSTAFSPQSKLKVRIEKATSGGSLPYSPSPNAFLNLDAEIKVSYDTGFLKEGSLTRESRKSVALARAARAKASIEATMSKDEVRKFLDDWSNELQEGQVGATALPGAVDPMRL